jgi:hypothetical protein
MIIGVVQCCAFKMNERPLGHWRRLFTASRQGFPEPVNRGAVQVDSALLGVEKGG